MEGSLRSAFLVGRSDAVGGTLTDMVAIAGDNVQAELWIGVNDKLPRMMRAVYPKDPVKNRYETEFSNWVFNGEVDDNTFVSERALNAPRMEFKNPDTEASRSGRFKAFLDSCAILSVDSLIKRAVCRLRRSYREVFRRQRSEGGHDGYRRADTAYCVALGGAGDDRARGAVCA
jgi:Predicted periplasmic protein (DUF2092)